MPLTSLTLGRVIGLVSAVLMLTLALATPSALAGGDPGGGPPESYADLTLDAFTLTKDMSVVFAGTLTCIQPLNVTISMAVQQGPPAHFVSLHQSAEVHCEPGTSYPIEWIFDPVDPARFHPGMLSVGIEMEGWTVPDEQGNNDYFQQFGIVDVEVRY